MVSGIVNTLEKNKYGFYNFTLINDDIKYGAGKFPPKFSEGDFVEFEAKQNEKGFWNIDNRSVRASKPTESVQTAVKAAAAAAPQTKDQYWARKEERDIITDEKREIGA